MIVRRPAPVGDMCNAAAGALAAGSTSAATAHRIGGWLEWAGDVGVVASASSAFPAPGPSLLFSCPLLDCRPFLGCRLGCLASGLLSGTLETLNVATSVELSLRSTVVLTLVAGCYNR